MRISMKQCRKYRFSFIKFCNCQSGADILRMTHPLNDRRAALVAFSGIGCSGRYFQGQSAPDELHLWTGRAPGLSKDGR